MMKQNKKLNRAALLTPKLKKNRFNPVFLVLFIVLVIYVIGILVPVLWGVLVSFIPHDEYSTYIHNPLSFPTSLTFENYINGFLGFNYTPAGGSEQQIGQILFQTVFYAGSCALAGTIVPCIVAYLAARFDFKFSKVIYGIVIVTMAIPIIGNMPAEISMAQTLGIFDNLWLFWVMKAHFLGMYFLVFYAMFRNIPTDYTEAAKIDGAGNFKIMLKVIFPFVLGTFGIVFLLNFITYWNDYQVPYYYLQSYSVVGSAVFLFSINENMVRTPTGDLGHAPQLFAMIFIVAIPIIILALIFNKRLMGGFSDGGVKE